MTYVEFCTWSIFYFVDLSIIARILVPINKVISIANFYIFSCERYADEFNSHWMLIFVIYDLSILIIKTIKIIVDWQVKVFEIF